MAKAAFKIGTGNAVYDNLPLSGGEFLNSHLKKVGFSKPNETIYKNGDYINFLYFPVDCVFSTVKVKEDEASVEVNLTGNKSLLGINSLFN